MMNPLPCESPGRAYAGHHQVRRWLSVLVLASAAGGCIGPDLVQCESGLACPATERCDEIHLTCVHPEQLTVCEGVADGTDCAAGPVSGGCFDSVCLARGCGNRVVEPGEMCDDGNQISGDGCNSDCRSTERCGNGFVDPGEPCDDGNLMSRDGCDSQCNVEEFVWSDAIPIAPPSINSQYSAYDVARGLVVYAATEGTWEWDGTRWTFTPRPDDSSIEIKAVSYDPDRGRVSMIGRPPDGSTRLFAWIDHQWVTVDDGGGPTLTGSAVVLARDDAQHRLLVFQCGTGVVWAVDSAGAWSPLPGVPENPGDLTAVVDPTTSELVLENTASVEWVFNGIEWTSASTALGSRVSMVFDPGRGHVVLVDNVNLTTYERIGGAWSAIENADVPCFNNDLSSSMALYYDTRSAVLTLFNSDADRICQLGQGWTLSPLQLPFNPIGAGYDPVHHSFVVLHNARPEDPESPTELWQLGDHGLQRIETPDPPLGHASMLAVYSPGRGATVLYGEPLPPPDERSGSSGRICDVPIDQNADTWSTGGTSWSLLTQFTRNGPPCGISAAAYDATNGRVALATSNEVWTLKDTDQAWQRLGAPPSTGDVYDLAWDARNDSFMAGRVPDSGEKSVFALYELRSGDWAPIEVGPLGLATGEVTLASDLRAGTVIVISDYVGRAWEHAGADWVRLPDSPHLLHFMSAPWTAYDPTTGRTLYIGRSGIGVFAATLQRTSATPLESCVDGEDADGDGLAGCSDPDCKWSCK